MTLQNVDFQSIARRAHRERAEAVHRLLVRPLLGFFRGDPGKRRHKTGRGHEILKGI